MQLRQLRRVEAEQAVDGFPFRIASKSAIHRSPRECLISLSARRYGRPSANVVSKAARSHQQPFVHTTSSVFEESPITERIDDEEVCSVCGAVGCGWRGGSARTQATVSVSADGDAGRSLGRA